MQIRIGVRGRWKRIRVFARIVHANERARECGGYDDVCAFGEELPLPDIRVCGPRFVAGEFQDFVVLVFCKFVFVPVYQFANAFGSVKS